MKWLSLLLVVTLATLCNAQQHDHHACGTPDFSRAQTQAIEEEMKIALTALDQRNSGTTCVPVKIHVVRETDGSGGLSEEHINIGIANLNYAFYGAGLEFYICGDIDYIDNSAYYNFDSNDESALAAEADEANNALNLYFTNTVTLGTPVGGYAYFASNNISSTRSFTRSYDVLNAMTLEHEIGHNFNLYHTFLGTENGNTSSNAEHVPRTGGNSNCAVAGDFLCDTQADPRIDAGNNYNVNTCTYTGTETDVFGNVYTPDIDNIMSYYSPYLCNDAYSFTAGQHNRIAATLTIRQSHTAYSLDCPPTAVNIPTNLTANQNGNEVTLNWTDNANNETGYLIEISTTSATSGFNAMYRGGVASNVTTFSIPDLASNTQYWFRIKPSNGDCNSYSNVADVVVSLVYCTPTSDPSPCDVFGNLGVSMDDFRLSDGATILIDNPNNGCTGGHSDYSSSIIGNVTVGNTYQLRIELDNDNGSSINQTVSIWIDGNQDGDFDDADEQVLVDYAGGGYIYNTTITIPANAQNGFTKMRVRSRFNDGSAVPACGELVWSEAEDYSLSISGGALPVELVDFSAFPRQQEVQLTWATLTELNSDYFQIERSKDGKSFENIGRIEAAGFADSKISYQFLDKKPLIGTSYYRLNQVDINGESDYSEWKTVQFNVPFTTNIYPNPVTDNQIFVALQHFSNSEVFIEIFDLQGKCHFKASFDSESGENLFEIPVNQLNSGLFILKLSQGDIVQSKRFFKK